MIIRASHFRHEIDMSPLEAELSDIENQRRLILRKLPPSLREEPAHVGEMFEYVALATAKAIEKLLQNPLGGHSGKLFSSRMIDEKREQLRKVMGDEDFIRKVQVELGNRLENRNLSQDLDLKREEEASVKKVSTKLLRSHIRIYILQILDELEELFEEREEEEREIMKKYFPQSEENQIHSEHPGQYRLFE